MSRPACASWTAQVWDGETRIVNVEGLSYDAARHVGLASNLAPDRQTTRLMCDDADWCEVYAPTGYREGPFAQTTLVIEVSTERTRGET